MSICTFVGVVSAASSGIGVGCCFGLRASCLRFSLASISFLSCSIADQNSSSAFTFGSRSFSSSLKQANVTHRFLLLCLTHPSPPPPPPPPPAAAACFAFNFISLLRPSRILSLCVSLSNNYGKKRQIE